MKKLLFLSISLIMSSILFGQSNAPIYDNVIFIDQLDFNPDQKSTVYVPSPFAKPELQIPNNEEWSNRKITKITYLYSQNKNNPTFGQNKLSNDRYDNLVVAYPSIENNENIEWETQVQNGCPDNDCAKDLYHGFIIEYEIVEMKKAVPLFGHDQLEEQQININASKENVIEGKNGTMVLIPANSFVDQNGSIAYGLVTVTLKEAITTEDIVMGGLTTLTSDNQILQSKGMVEITVQKKGQELSLGENKELTISIPTGYEEGYSHYEGVETETELSWNQPKAILRTDNQIVMNQENQMRWGVRGFWKQDKLVEYKREKGEINKMTIHLAKEDVTFFKSRYTKKDGRRSGLTMKQSRIVQKWFDEDKVVEGDLTSAKEKKGLFINWRFLPFSNNLAGGEKGTNYSKQDPDLVNVFKMKKLGWANVDRLAKMKNTKKIRFNVAQEEIDSIVNFNISLIVPKANIYLPGYQKEDSYYSFTHGDNEDKVPMPIGELAYVIAIGEKNGQTYFEMKEVTLGDNEYEFLSMVKRDKAEAIKEVKETL